MTIGDICTWLLDPTVTRNIANEAVYGAAGSTDRRTYMHHHIKTVLNNFIRQTKCNREVDEMTLESAQWQFDVTADIPRFRADLLLDLWIYGEEPIKLVDDSVVRAKRLEDESQTGAPIYIGFIESRSLICWPTTDADYTLYLRRNDPLIDFTPGDGNADALEVNLPDDILSEIIPTGIVASLQGLELEMANPTNMLVMRYQELIKSYGAPRLGSRVTDSLRRSDYEDALLSE